MVVPESMSHLNLPASLRASWYSISLSSVWTKSSPIALERMLSGSMVGLNDIWLSWSACWRGVKYRLLTSIDCYYYYSTSLFILFISSFTDAPYTSLFAIVYTIAYPTQSLNIALFSCLLRTLGIVIHLYAQYISCLLRTLAVWYHVTAPRNLAVRFCTLSPTCLVTSFYFILLQLGLKMQKRLELLFLFTIYYYI